MSTEPISPEVVAAAFGVTDADMLAVFGDPGTPGTYAWAEARKREADAAYMANLDAVARFMVARLAREATP